MDVDVRDYNLKALRQKIGFIPQRPCFTGTIARTSLWERRCSVQELEQAAEISQRNLSTVEERFDTHLAEGGSNLQVVKNNAYPSLVPLSKIQMSLFFDDSFLP